MTRRVLGAGLAVWIVLVVSLGSAGAAPQTIALAGVVAIAVVTVAVGLHVGRRVDTVVWGRRPPSVQHPGSDQHSVRLRRQLESGRRNGSPELRDTLISLVDDRLSAHHGIDRQADPDAARALLDPVLQRLLSDPRPPSLRDLRRIVPAIEML